MINKVGISSHTPQSKPVFGMAATVVANAVEKEALQAVRAGLKQKGVQVTRITNNPGIITRFFNNCWLPKINTKETVQFTYGETLSKKALKKAKPDKLEGILKQEKEIAKVIRNQSSEVTIIEDITGMKKHLDLAKTREQIKEGVQKAVTDQNMAKKTEPSIKHYIFPKFHRFFDS